MAFNYSPKIVTDSILMYLDAGNPKSYSGSGTSFTDLSKNNYGFTLTNGPTFDSADNGSIVLDGTNDYIVSTTSFGLGSAMTYNFWLKCTTNANHQSIFSSGYQGSLGFVWFYRNLTNNAILMQYSDGSTYVTTGSTYIGMWNGFNNLWINITVTVDYVGASISWYRNGVLVSGPSALSTPVAPTTSFFRYISTYNGTQYPFLGNISIVQLYSRILTDSEILKNYNALKGRYL